MTERQKRLLAVLTESKDYISTAELIRRVGGYSVNNNCEDTHDTTSREELRSDKLAINAEITGEIRSTRKGYKLATLAELMDRAEYCRLGMRRFQREQRRLEHKIRANG